jgi:RNA polymerase primary sigma factor
MRREEHSRLEVREDDVDSQPLRYLLERADEQGFLTVDDLLDVFPSAEQDLREIEELLETLSSYGVDFITPEGSEVVPLASGKGGVASQADTPVKVADVTEIDAHDSVSLYLKQMASTALLSREEEVGLAKKMEQGTVAQRRLQKGGQKPYLRRRYLRQVELGKQARRHLIKANTRLVVSIAKRYRGLGVAFLDLIQEGNLGLMKAVQKFDYRRGCKFSTYATWWIRQCITRSLSEQGRTIRLPCHVNDRIRKVYRTAQRLEQRTGKAATAEDIAEAVGLAPARVRWLIQKSHHAISLQKPVGEEGDSELGQFIEDRDSPAPDEEAALSLLSDRVDEALATLTPREERIIRLRYGLDGGRSYSLKEVAAMYGLTRERIRQIQRDALQTLKDPDRNRKLRAFVN